MKWLAACLCANSGLLPCPVLPLCLRAQVVGLDVGGPSAARAFHARGISVEDYSWPQAKRFYL